jgi:tRNA G18 (ribose-2'-O)-methylase SpoU
MFVMREIIIVLDDIRSTHNVGSILRSADGFGISKVILTGYTPYPRINNDQRLPHEIQKATSAIAKTALGAEKTMSIERYENYNEIITKLKESGFLIVSIEQSNNSVPINTLKSTPRLVLIVGNEIDGVNKNILKYSDVIAEIPMKGRKESFNVSVAAAIAMYATTVGSDNV